MSSEPSRNGHHWIATVIEQFEGRLMRYAQRITGDLERARDVVQETFVRLCREDRRQLDGHLAQWLFTVCRNQALDVRRKENRMHPLSETLAETCASREPAQETELEQQDAAARIYRLLADLPENQQEVVRLKFQGGLSYKEISAVTGLSVTYVGWLLHTALGRLREELNPSEGARRDRPKSGKKDNSESPLGASVVSRGRQPADLDEAKS